jgi:hypothetical protein
VPASAVFDARRRVALNKHRQHILSCPWLRVQSSISNARARPGRRRRIASDRYERPFHGIECPTTLESTSSDLHRDYLTRLRYACRLSQPLDVSFRPYSFQPCFMPVTPLGFHFQRVPPPGSRHASRRACPSCCSPRRRSAEPQLQGLMHPVGPFALGRCYPGSNGRSSPSLYPPEGFPPSDLGLVLPRSLPSWASVLR